MNKMKLASLSSRLGFPPKTTFLGCAVFLHQNDEFLAQHQVTSSGQSWAWTQSPFNAHKYKDYPTALKAARQYTKANAEVIYLFDSPKQLFVLGHEEVNGDD